VVIEQRGQRVVVRQIVGVLARRIVCRTKEGAEVRAGDRFGVMKFGSRMDVFLPADATILVGVGDAVVGGVTVVATLGPQGGRAS
jgi:phosphatidylserine decarboxylase